jgi:Tol biopolymer transport system component
MNRSDGFDRHVSEWLHADAEHRVPDHLGAVLRRTRTERQRPAWSSLERWLPVDTTFRPGLFSASSRRLVLAALVLVALLALVLVAVGSRQQRLPAPFGPARNGVLLASADGDIFRIDPTTGQHTSLIGGSQFDFGPLFSRDGTKFSFLRGAPTDCGKSDCGLILVVANADGTGVQALTQGLPALDSVDWSPDGRQIAILSEAPTFNGHVIDVVNVDGTGMRTLDVGRPAHEITWLPSAANEIVFRGEQLNATDPPPGIFAVRSDGTGLRQISTTPATSANDYHTIALSPDGTLVAYRDDGDPGGFQIHVMDLQTKAARILPGPRGQLGPVFSPDSRLVVYLRGLPNDQYQLVVAPADGSTSGTAVGPTGPLGPDGPTINNYFWSPDGTAVLANYDADKVARSVPIDGSQPTTLIHGELAFPGYQRLAP